MLVSGWQQALTVLVVIIPGFVYQGLRSRLRGPTPEDQELGVRILRALTASGLLALAYVITLGPLLTDAAQRPLDALDHPRVAAMILLTLVFVVPAAVAVVLHVRAVSKLYPGLPWREKFSVYDPTPTAWDFAVNRVGPGFVRVLTKDGSWVGGYAGQDSFFTNYPRPREIFIEQAWKLGNSGEFERAIEGSSGEWVKCDDAPIVQFLEAKSVDTGDDKGQEPSAR
jgi:hypothetical protein